MTFALYCASLRQAVIEAFRFDIFDTAKATAYSGMLMLAPAFLVATTILALMPTGNIMLDELRVASEQFLPADTMSLVQSYFELQRGFSLQLLLSATFLSGLAAWGVTATLMDGFRRAYRLPPRGWSYLQQRVRSLLLVPIALVPLSMATFVVIFGNPIEQWMIVHSEHGLKVAVLLLWRLARWSLALLTSATVLGAVFHFGTNVQEKWTCIVPGAATATLLWFPVTLAFGAYVTRVADYSVIYGSLGTAIATLVWLYLSSFSVLLGAQVNGVLYRERRRKAVVARSAARAAALAEAKAG